MAEWILGIETSCDETSAAVLSRGELPDRGVRAELAGLSILSQDVHRIFGGVVPELASWRARASERRRRSGEVLRENGRPRQLRTNAAVWQLAASTAAKVLHHTRSRCPESISAISRLHE